MLTHVMNVTRTGRINRIRYCADAMSPTANVVQLSL